jgi:hypothetical protein
MTPPKATADAPADDALSRRHIGSLLARIESLSLAVTPAQVSLLSVILNRDDKFLVQQFEDALGGAERGQPQRFIELLRMAETLSASMKVYTTVGAEAPPALGEACGESSNGLSDRQILERELIALGELILRQRAEAVEYRDAKKFDQALACMKELKQTEGRAEAVRRQVSSLL